MWDEDPPDPGLDAVAAWFEQHPPINFASWGREGEVIAVTLAWESRDLAQPLEDAFGALVRVEVEQDGAHYELQ